MSTRPPALEAEGRTRQSEGLPSGGAAGARAPSYGACNRVKAGQTTGSWPGMTL